MVEVLYLPYCRTAGDREVILYNDTYIMRIVARYNGYNVHYSYKLYHRYDIDIDNRIGQWVWVDDSYTKQLRPPLVFIVGSRLLITEYYVPEWQPHSIITWKIPKLIFYVNTNYRHHARHELMTRPAFLVGYALTHYDIGRFLRDYVY